MIDFTYGWDVNRRKLSEVNGLFAMQSHQYGYDNEDRLVDAKRGDIGQQNWERQQSWSLSAVGDWSSTTVNGTTETRTHDAVHELTAVGSASLAYDAKGNLVTNGATGWTYTWDHENHMTGADFETAPTTSAVYAYDALGRRVSKVVEVTGNEFTTSTTTVFVNDKDWREVAEFQTSGTTGNPPGTPALTQEYIFGDYIDEVLLMRKANGDKYFYHSNDLYSVAALTNANGAVLERYKYDPYGKVTVLAPDGTTVRTASCCANPWCFTGRRLDAETGLIYYRSRLYDASQGRLLSRDPLGYVDRHASLYGYVEENPVLSVDPSGLRYCTVADTNVTDSGWRVVEAGGLGPDVDGKLLPMFLKMVLEYLQNPIKKAVPNIPSINFRVYLEFKYRRDLTFHCKCSSCIAQSGFVTFNPTVTQNTDWVGGDQGYNDPFLYLGDPSDIPGINLAGQARANETYPYRVIARGLEYTGKDKNKMVDSCEGEMDILEQNAGREQGVP